MYKVIILPFAKEDISKAAKWYNSQKKGLGKKFTTQIRSKAQFISSNPKAAPIRYDDVRTILIDSFPFMLHYLVDDQNEKIIIIAVFHTSQNPNNWKNRR